MQQINTPAVTQTFAALGDPTRSAIIARLAEGETTLSDIAEPFSMSQTAVTKHVQILSKAGLVDVTKRGRTRFCKLNVAPMKQAEQWLETYQQFWSQNFASLSHFLDEENTQ